MPMVNQPDGLGRVLADFERRIRILEATSPLTSASIQVGALRVLDASLAEHVRIGKQDDSSYGINIDGGPVRALDLAFSEAGNQNVPLSTTSVESGIVTVTPPDWATTVVVQTYSVVQMRNNTASAQAVQLRAMAHEIPSSGLWSDDVGPGEWGIAFDFYQRTLTRDTDFTTTVEASTEVAVSVSTNAQNWVRTKATLYYLR